jgi:hypothetical protein
MLHNAGASEKPFFKGLLPHLKMSYPFGFHKKSGIQIDPAVLVDF